MIDKIKEIRIELDYGISYALESDLYNTESSSSYMGLNKLIEARMHLGRYLFYLGSNDPYPNMDNPNNEIIESGADLVDKSIVEVNPEFTKVKHLKFVIKGLRLALEKVVGIKMTRNDILNPRKKILGLKSIDDTLSSLELSICYFGKELRDISEKEPGKYSSFIETSFEENDSNDKNKELTDSIIEERSKEKRTTKKE